MRSSWRLRSAARMQTSFNCAPGDSGFSDRCGLSRKLGLPCEHDRSGEECVEAVVWAVSRVTAPQRADEDGSGLPTTWKEGGG